MTFTNLFGKTFKRNPNLIDTDYSFTECDFIHNTLCELSFTKEEFEIIVEPILNKLNVYNNCFLQSELTFIKKVLTDIEIQDIHKYVHTNTLNKTCSYLEDKYIKENRLKAEL